ncbi:MAG: alpha/beta hydrolase [Kiritimatiellae bacterium]|nr:alpha/beta hydrolase [Kiritimatiellia bacterium]
MHNVGLISSVLACSVFASLAMVRTAAGAEADVVTHPDIEYARVGDLSLRLDLHIPKGVANPPLIVWIHGGGWRKGKRNVARVRGMLEHGYALAGIQYRLSQEALFPAQIHDCKAAIRWLRAHAAAYGYDAGRLGVGGGSAGGHLAALLGTSAGVGELEGKVGGHFEQSSRVQAVCDMWGPTDFLQMGGGHNRAKSPESQLIGGPIQEHKEKVAVANPISYVDENDPPFLLLHGDRDRAVPLSQSQLLHAALCKAGVASELKVLQGAEHGARGYPAEKMKEWVLAFFGRHLKRPK